MKNFNIYDHTEFNILKKQSILSSEIKVVKELDKSNFEEYRIKRARFYFNKVNERRCNLNMTYTLSPREKQSINCYLREKKRQKTKLTDYDIILIEYTVGICSKDEFLEFLKDSGRV
jgi:IS4 transposase